MFSEVDVIGFIPSNDPTYRKPELGNLCVIKRPMLIKWGQVAACIRSQHFPDRWTDIPSPIGLVTLDMPYELVVIAIKAANVRKCKSCGMPT